MYCTLPVYYCVYKSAQQSEAKEGTRERETIREREEKRKAKQSKLEKRESLTIKGTADNLQIMHSTLHNEHTRVICSSERSGERLCGRAIRHLRVAPARRPDARGLLEMGYWWAAGNASGVSDPVARQVRRVRWRHLGRRAAPVADCFSVRVSSLRSTVLKWKTNIWDTVLHIRNIAIWRQRIQSNWKLDLYLQYIQIENFIAFCKLSCSICSTIVRSRRNNGASHLYRRFVCEKSRLWLLASERFMDDGRGSRWLVLVGW